MREAVVQEGAASSESSVLKAIEGLAEQVKKLAEVQKESRPYSRRSGLDQDGNRVCFACRSKSHMIRDCPKKKATKTTEEELNCHAPQQ